MRVALAHVLEKLVFEHVGMWVLSALGLFAAFWVVFISPALTGLRELREALAISEEAVAHESQVRTQYQALVDLSTTLSAEETQMRSRLTKVDDVETLSGQISQLAREADLVVRSVEQQRDSVGDQFAQVLVRVVITGSYKQIEDFFRRVGAQPRLMAVPRFDMREPIIKDEQVSLTAECYIAVLRDLKLEEKTAVAKR